MEEILQSIWGWLVAVVSGLGVGTMVTAIAVGCLKGWANKLVTKINIKGIEDRAVNEGLSQIKDYTFKVSIEPLVKSEIAKVEEEIDKRNKERYDKIEAQNQQIIGILERFASYFDDSIAIPETKKQELKDEIEKAKLPPKEVEIVVEKPVVEEPKKTAKKPPVAVETSVER